MIRYVMRRLFMMVPVLFGVLLLIFTILYFSPGDPARNILGVTATEEEVQMLREELGLNDSYFVQFSRYVGNLLQGDLGRSYRTNKQVSTEILARFPTTFALASLSIAFAAIVGVTAGVISAIRQYSIFDNLATGVSLLGISMPNFWLGLMLIILVSLQWRLLPASGLYGLKYWILPIFTIGTGYMAGIMRITRSSMLEVIRQDYIRTARAKGQKEGVVLAKHALKNAIIPVITLIGLQFGRALGGAVLTETVFAIPGLGKWLVESISAKDIPVIQGGVLFMAVMFGFVNLFVDILYGFIDPRIGSQYRRRKERVVKPNAS